MPIRTGAALAVAALYVAGCATLPGPSEPQDGAPAAAPPGLAELPDPVPRKEPRSRYGNPDVYTVAGRSYRIMKSARGYRRTGNASWYGTKFHGRRTSSGEPFDMYALTAAHRTLPIPTYVRVTRLDDGRSTVVRVNDRGPFHDERIIDVSYAAAVKLGFEERGTAPVLVEVVEPPPAQPVALQAGAFATFAAADRLQQTLRTLTGAPAFVVKVSADALYRVRLGPFTDPGEAERVRQQIVDAELADPLLVR